MFKFMNNPYLSQPFYEADKGGGTGGDGEETGGDDQDEEDSDEDGDEDQEEKKFSQKEIDEAVQKKLAREKRKWQREQQKKDTEPDKKQKEKEKADDQESPADKKAREAEARAEAMELKWTCLEHDVKKDCVDDVLALAKVHMAKDEDIDIEDAIDKVLKKYPQFKDGYDETESDEEDQPEKKGWGQRHSKTPKKTVTLEDELSRQLFGK